MGTHAIDTVLKEQRVFEPSEEFRSRAHIKSMAEYERLYEEAERDPEGFWAGIARELHWFEPWTRARMECAVGEVVRRRQNESLVTTASTGMSPPGARTKPPSSGKASRARSAR